MERIRQDYLERIAQDLEIIPVCALLGPRQCGKTTLARQFSKTYDGPTHYFDLEDYTDLAKLSDPKLTLDPLEGLVIIDEVQRRPDLFEYLRVLVDKKPLKFLILGSASRDLLQQSSETLAGRVSYVDVTPFQVLEVMDQTTLWTRGGFPRSFLAASDQASVRWRQIYMQTYFERDLVELGVNLPPHRILKLWAMLAQYHGSLINYATMAQFLDVSVPTLKNYLAMLEGTFMIRTLSPWFENQGKRLVKSPKLYIRDSGVFHSLQSIESFEGLTLNIHRGVSWEGYALEQVIVSLNLRTQDCYFWATHQQAELDLFIPYKSKRIGFEFKCTSQPSITKSMTSARTFLRLDHLYIVTPIQETFSLSPQTTVLALKDCKRAVRRLVDPEWLGYE